MGTQISTRRQPTIVWLLLVVTMVVDLYLGSQPGFPKGNGAIVLPLIAGIVGWVMYGIYLGSCGRRLTGFLFVILGLTGVLILLRLMHLV